MCNINALCCVAPGLRAESSSACPALTAAAYIHCFGKSSGVSLHSLQPADDWLIYVLQSVRSYLAWNLLKLLCGHNLLSPIRDAPAGKRPHLQGDFSELLQCGLPHQFMSIIARSDGSGRKCSDTDFAWKGGRMWHSWMRSTCRYCACACHTKAIFTCLSLLKT